MSLGQLVAEVTRDLSTLVRQEITLAKAEAAESAKSAGKGAGMLAGAGYGAGMVLLFLSLALWWALGTVMGLGWSALVVAVVWAIIAAVLALVGRREIQQAPGLSQTTDTLRKIPNALQGHEEKNR
ncbi:MULTISPECIES: phage holin family protein [unclassified Isoptericola]|uniref:phage holin family protein n=1 Tax=Isoptericola sp. NPDC057191 TaxID=3346041 RepID=UPI00364245B3